MNFTLDTNTRNTSTRQTRRLDTLNLGDAFGKMREAILGGANNVELWECGKMVALGHMTGNRIHITVTA